MLLQRLCLTRNVNLIRCVTEFLSGCFLYEFRSVSGSGILITSFEIRDRIDSYSTASIFLGSRICKGSVFTLKLMGSSSKLMKIL